MTRVFCQSDAPSVVETTTFSIVPIFRHGPVAFRPMP